MNPVIKDLYITLNGPAMSVNEGVSLRISWDSVDLEEKMRLLKILLGDCNEPPV